MKILLIDDSTKQIEAAKEQLSGHDLTIVTTFSEALMLIENYFGVNGPRGQRNPKGFDVVLTDLMMPAEEEGIKSSGKVGDPTPYGFVIALLAIRAGVNFVAIVSNGHNETDNHHNSGIAYACDNLNKLSLFDGKFKIFTGYKSPNMRDVGKVDIKNWKYVLGSLLSS